MSNTCDVQTGNTGRKGVRAINEPGAKGATMKKIFFVSPWIGGSISLLGLYWLVAPGTA